MALLTAKPKVIEKLFIKEFGSGVWHWFGTGLALDQKQKIKLAWVPPLPGSKKYPKHIIFDSSETLFELPDFLSSESPGHGSEPESTSPSSEPEPEHESESESTSLSSEPEPEHESEPESTSLSSEPKPEHESEPKSTSQSSEPEPEHGVASRNVGGCALC